MALTVVVEPALAEDVVGAALATDPVSVALEVLAELVADELPDDPPQAARSRHVAATSSGLTRLAAFGVGGANIGGTVMHREWSRQTPARGTARLVVRPHTRTGAQLVACLTMRLVYRLGVFIPIALVLDAAGASAAIVFVTSAVGVIPIAALMSEATEHLAARSGPGVGGLVNVTFGNAPELIIAIFALGHGLQEVVKASIVGSVVGNALLVLGASMLAGGWGRARQQFDRTLAQTQSGLLMVTVVALSLPAVIVVAGHQHLPRVGLVREAFGGGVDGASVAVAGILIATYAAGLFFSLKTHRDVFNPAAASEDLTGVWSLRRSVLVLAAAAGAVCVMSDVLVGSIEHASQQIGLSPFFVGAFVVAIVGNASEHYVAVVAAARDKMDLAVSIAIGSSAQVGLFVAPVLVLVSYVVGPAPMALVFNPYEIAALLSAGFVATSLISDGESTWLEGVQLLALYAVLGVIFYVA